MKKNKILSDGVLAFILIAVILLIDQFIKIEVKTHFCLGESIHITDWFYISFVENNGMAYGMTFFNKLVLSLFRLVAITAIGWYLRQVLKQKHTTGYIVVLSVRWETFSTPCSMDSSSNPLLRSVWQASCPLEQAMPLSCKARWSTCSISR